MKSVMILALSLMGVGICPQDSASGQSAPPVSLAAPTTSPPRANARNPSAASDRLSSAPASGELPQAANPAADYDGFSVGSEDNDVPDQAPRFTTSPAPRNARSNPDPKANAAQQLIDQEDEALKRRLTICHSCK